MKCLDLHLEKIEIPIDAEAKAKQAKDNEWQKRLSDHFCLSIWDTTDNPDHFSGKQADLTCKYVIGFHSNFGDIGKVAKKLKKDTKSKETPHETLATYIYDNMVKVADANGHDYFYWGMIGDVWSYFWVGDRLSYEQMRADFSAILRDLTKDDFKKYASKTFQALVENQNSGNMTKVAKKLLKDASSLPQFEEAFEWINQIDATPKDMINLLAVLGLIYGDKEQFKLFAQKLNIAEKLSEDNSTKEKLFDKIQKMFVEYCIDNRVGFATKMWIEKLVVRLGGTLSAYGYGIYPESIVTMIRLFDNDVEEGLSLEDYNKNNKYNSKDYAYSDSLEYEEKADKLWSEIDVTELLKKY